MKEPDECNKTYFIYASAPAILDFLSCLKVLDIIQMLVFYCCLGNKYKFQSRVFCSFHVHTLVPPLLTNF